MDLFLDLILDFKKQLFHSQLEQNLPHLLPSLIPAVIQIKASAPLRKMPPTQLKTMPSVSKETNAPELTATRPLPPTCTSRPLDSAADDRAHSLVPTLTAAPASLGGERRDDTLWQVNGVPTLTMVGIIALLVVCIGVLVPGLTLFLFGYQAALKKHKRGLLLGGLTKFHVSLFFALSSCMGVVVQGVIPIPDCTYAAFNTPPGSCTASSCYNVRTCGIRQAVDTFDSVATIAKYGMVQDWDVSLVTDMSRVFFNKGTFNEDISKWEVGRVTNMAVSTYSESLPRSKLGSFLFASLLILIFNSMCLSVPLHPFPFDRWTSLCLVRSVLLRW